MHMTWRLDRFALASSVLACSMACPMLAFGADALSASEAAVHLGEKATVCGVVASARFAEKSKGQPTFLNLDKAYPAQVFTILIARRSRKVRHTGAHLCGKDCLRHWSAPGLAGPPEMIVYEPSQLVVRMERARAAAPLAAIGAPER